MGLLDRPDGSTLLAIFIVCALGLLALAGTAIRGRMADRPRRWSAADQDAPYPAEAPAAAVAAAAPAVRVTQPPVEKPAAEKKTAPPRKRTAARKTTTAKQTTPRSTAAKKRP